MIKAGELRHRITLQEKTSAQNPFGGEVIVFVDWATVWAKVETLSGSEFIIQKQAGASLSHKITIRHRDGVIPTMQVVWDVRVMDITAVVDDNQAREMILLCTEQGATSNDFVVGTSAIGGSGVVG